MRLPVSYDWQVDYLAATLETQETQLVALVDRVHTSLCKRLKSMATAAGSLEDAKEELLAICDALSVLRVLEKERLGLVLQKERMD